MGRFLYQNAANSVEVDDRALAHLRLVIMTKLRRGEPFMFETSSPHGTGRRDFWMHPTIAVQFYFAGSRPPQINHRWVDSLMESANSADGLRMVPEPPS